MFRYLRNTPVTQDGDLAAICKIGQIAADRRRVVVRSQSTVGALQITGRSPGSPRSQPSFEHAQNKRSEVAAETGRHNIAANTP